MYRLENPVRLYDGDSYFSRWYNQYLCVARGWWPNTLPRHSVLDPGLKVPSIWDIIYLLRLRVLLGLESDDYDRVLVQAWCCCVSESAPVSENRVTYVS